MRFHNLASSPATRAIFGCLVVFVAWSSVGRADVTTTVTFETFPEPLDSFQTNRGPFPDNQTSTPGPFGGNDIRGEMTVDGLVIANVFNDAFMSYSGFAASQRPGGLWNRGDANMNGFPDEFENGNDTITANGSGDGGSAGWVVAFSSGEMSVGPNSTFADIRINNTQTAADAIRNGNGPSDAFGSRNQDESFTVTFSDLDDTDSVEVTLASYDLASNTLQIVEDFTTVDLTSLAANRIGISFDSTDTSTFSGQTFIDTPTYVAIDNVSFITAVPEPTTWLGCAVVAVGGIVRHRRRRADPVRT